ncbi:MAG TPA: peptidoglycan-binding domain-containing protein [Gemmatimonadaceae bacterium]|nr:peptidoglycan-binding domain-containing protein [Gemmatimonadaceae bacterium]
MSDDLLPLVLMWALRNRSCPPSGTPTWPSSGSPPPAPPPPAPPPTDANTATPLGDLKGGGGKFGGGGATFDLDEESKLGPPGVQAAIDAAKRAASQRAIPRVLKKLVPTGPPAPELVTTKVSELQRLLNARGARLTPDGLFGPKTAKSWQTYAKSKKLPATITRASSTTARVSPTTLTSLYVPPIP